MNLPTATERTFQGILISLINYLIQTEDFNFSKITQEQNVGVKEARFSDCLLFSELDLQNIVLFELKDTNWDATDEILVRDAMFKAANRGYKYFVTGTPRQLVIFQTFKPNTTLFERKLKIYYLSNVKTNDEVLYPSYEKLILPNLKKFLRDLSDLVHEKKIIYWDSIDKYFVNKLSAYILETSAEMHENMYKYIHEEKDFKNKLSNYLKTQEVFNVSLNFDRIDVYNICQLSNYLLYLKIIFYSYLRNDVPSLKLKEIEIPKDKSLMNRLLRNRFDDVLMHDYEPIFKHSILDEFELPENYLPVFKRNVEEIKKLNFKDLNCDIIGAIYNTLIDNQEQHSRGQHFTNTNEVDIINAFCINKKTNIVLDSGCGAGTFLVRAYNYLKFYHKNFPHENLLERLWGIEIAPFPVFLSVMNLTLLKISSEINYPMIIQRDFSDIKRKFKYEGYFKNYSDLFQTEKIDKNISIVNIPVFDVCIGNPPYIQQELIDDKEKWNNLAKEEFKIHKINKQSDLYVYYLMHTASFLKDGGKLGYVISSSWLDVNFGTGLQEFILKNFKIKAILDNQVKRSFDTASINTIILILEKCSDKIERENNNVKFIRIFSDYEKFIGKSDDKLRIKKCNDFVSNILNQSENYRNDDFFITVINQKKLESESTVSGKYQNGNWGAKYLRSSDIYYKIIEKAKENLIPLSNVAEVKYGIKTGANEFFYVIDDTEKAINMDDKEYELIFGFPKMKNKIDWKHYGWYYSDMTNRHYIIEKRFFKPLFKTQKESVNLEVDIENLKYKVLICNETKSSLKKYKNKLIAYINDGESKNYHKRPTCAQRISQDKKQDWFNLGEELFIGDFIFPSKIGEKYRLIDNRKTKIYCDKVNYNIKVRKKYEKYSDIIFLILNCTLFRSFFDLFSRQLTGKQTLSDIDVNVIEKTLIIKPELLLKYEKDLKNILVSLKNREQDTIFKEVKEKDRIALDTIILNELDLSKNDLKELYLSVCNYVQERSEKSKSVSNNKVKKQLNYEETILVVKDHFPEINRYKDLIKNIDTKRFFIYDLKIIYNKDDLIVSDNLFKKYDIQFKDINKKITISFENLGQLQLFYFFYEKLEFRNDYIEIPKDKELCLKIFDSIILDYKRILPQVKSFLKSSRIKHNALSIYREIVLEKILI